MLSDCLFPTSRDGDQGSSTEVGRVTGLGSPVECHNVPPKNQQGAASNASSLPLQNTSDAVTAKLVSVTHVSQQWL